jgi:branched-chain amino acid aminotransferase
MTNPVVYVNGLFWPINKANVSVSDRGFIYGDGLFETMRAYSGKVFRLDYHLDRLFYSANLIYIELPITRNEFKEAIYKTIKINGLSNSIVRITISRGEQNFGINIDHNSSPTIVIFVKSVSLITKKTYNNGVGVKLFKNSAIRLQGIPHQIKSCNYLSNILLREQALRDNFFEAVLLDENNNITEGTISNIFIIKNNKVITPKLNSFILSGIIRQSIIDICLENKIQFMENLIRENDLYDADEIFLTNSGIEILPVYTVNKHKLTKRGPGPITKRIHLLLLKSFED